MVVKSKSKKKGLSLLEKCSVLECYMLKHEEVYTLKMLEKIGPTLGVISKSVKEVLDALIKEKRVLVEKVGSTNIYWTFKTRFYRVAEEEKHKLTRMINQQKANIEELSILGKKSVDHIDLQKAKLISNSLLTKTNVLYRKQNQLHNSLRYIEAIGRELNSQNLFDIDEKSLMYNYAIIKHEHNFLTSAV